MFWLRGTPALYSGSTLFTAYDHGLDHQPALQPAVAEDGVGEQLWSQSSPAVSNHGSIYHYLTDILRSLGVKNRTLLVHEGLYVLGKLDTALEVAAMEQEELQQQEICIGKTIEALNQQMAQSCAVVLEASAHVQRLADGETKLWQALGDYQYLMAGSPSMLCEENFFEQRSSQNLHGNLQQIAKLEAKIFSHRSADNFWRAKLQRERGAPQISELEQALHEAYRQSANISAELQLNEERQAYVQMHIGFIKEGLGSFFS